MEVLLSYNVGLSSISIVKDLSGNYYYLVNDIDPEKYETIARLVGKALEFVGPQKSVSIYDVAKAVLTYLKDYDPELVTYVVSRELKYKKLQVLLDDPYVEDVSIVGTGPVWVRHKYVLEKDPSADYIETNIVVATYEELVSYMELAAERSGRVVNRRIPIMDFTLPEEDGGHRVHLVLPDVAHSTGELVIRKKLYHGFVDLDALVKAKVMPSSVAELIKLVVRKGGSIVILGPPGSGKTTLLKAILYSAIPRYWKIAIIEDTPEVDVPKGSSWVRYAVPTDVWGSTRGIDQMALAKAALRASVSRFLVIGETRGAEARVLVQAMNMGLGGLCLPGDQLVLAKIDGKIGLYEIREVVNGVLKGSHKRVEVVSLGADLEPTWQPVSAVVAKRGSNKFVRIEVENGVTHEVHEDHLVVAADTDLGLTLKKAKDLNPGDLLVSLPHPPKPTQERDFIEVPEIVDEDLNVTEGLHHPGLFTEGRSELTDRRVNRLPGSLELSKRFKLDRNLGYVLGLYLATGYVEKDLTRNTWLVHLDVESTKLTKLLEALASLGIPSEVVNTVRSLPKGVTHVTVEYRPLAVLLVGVSGSSKAEMKHVPLGIALESGNEFRVGLIEGYCDGLSDKVSLDYESYATFKMYAPSRKFAESLVLVLKTLGVRSYIEPPKPGTEEKYEICIVEEKDRENLLRVLGLKHYSYENLFPATVSRKESELSMLKVKRVDFIEKQSLLYDVEVPGTHLYAISGSLILTHNTTFHAGSPEEAIVRLTSPPIELAPQQLAMIWLFITLSFLEDGGLRRVVVRVDEPVLRSNSLVLNTVYRYGEDLDLETLLTRFNRARDLWV
ncbi:MAG: ATPase, T2SS/T4P/T4SS family [Sulfolobales archaeon]